MARRVQCQSSGVRFADMHGVSKAKKVPLSHLEHMMAGSELYTGAALDGVPQDVSDECTPSDASMRAGPIRRIGIGRRATRRSASGHMSGAGQNEPDTLFIDEHLKALLAA